MVGNLSSTSSFPLCTYSFYNSISLVFVNLHLLLVTSNPVLVIVFNTELLVADLAYAPAGPTGQNRGFSMSSEKRELTYCQGSSDISSTPQRPR